MHIRRFQQGDEVTYIGEKLFESDDGKPINLRGTLGRVVGRVQNSEVGVVVEFEGDAYIMDENRHLAKYVKKAKPEGDGPKQPEVQKRRGVSDRSEQGGKGRKRRNQEEG